MLPGLFAVAHGALGIFDEVFLVLAIIIFVVMLGLPIALAVINRNRSPKRDETLLTTPVAAAQPPDDADHFRLD